MTVKKDLHIHTVFSDGKNTPEEMVSVAIKKGLNVIGFSEHSYTHFDTSYCMKKSDIENYKTEITRLKEKYKNKITVLCGIEQDYFSDEDVNDYDFIIGSVHYLKVKGIFFPIDESKEVLLENTNKYFDGDIYAVAEKYFETVSKIADKAPVTIIGHFDLISKFNEKEPFFDEHDTRYINAWKKATDILLKKNIPFEINVGAIFRGYKTEPYPSYDIQKYISENGGKFVYSSDSHCVDGLCFDIDKY